MHSKEDSLAHHVAEAVALLEKIERQIVADTPTLTALEKKRSTRFRKGGDHVVAAIAELVDRFGLASDAIRPNVMKGRLADLQAIAPLQSRLAQLLTRVNDFAFLAGSDAWSEATVGYATLRHLARKRGDVQTSLEPIGQFFAARHESVRAERAKLRAIAKAEKSAKAAADAAAKAPGSNGAGPHA